MLSCGGAGARINNTDWFVILFLFLAVNPVLVVAVLLEEDVIVVVVVAVADFEILRFEAAAAKETELSKGRPGCTFLTKFVLLLFKFGTKKKRNN